MIAFVHSTCSDGSGSVHKLDGTSNRNRSRVTRVTCKQSATERSSGSVHHNRIFVLKPIFQVFTVILSQKQKTSGSDSCKYQKFKNQCPAVAGGIELRSCVINGLKGSLFNN